MMLKGFRLLIFSVVESAPRVSEVEMCASVSYRISSVVKSRPSSLLSPNWMELGVQVVNLRGSEIHSLASLTCFRVCDEFLVP